MRGPKGPQGPLGPRRSLDIPDTATPYRHEDHMPTMGLPKSPVYHPDYQRLPECVKASFSDKEYNSMPDEEKRTLIHDMTHPEVGED